MCFSFSVYLSFLQKEMIEPGCLYSGKFGVSVKLFISTVLTGITIKCVVICKILLLSAER